jgi:hypothetical protein
MWARLAQVLHFHVGSKPRVVGNVPARMIRIVINHNRIRIPQPVAHIAVFPGSYAPIPTVKPETARSATREMPNVARAKATVEVPVFPWMIEVKSRIVWRGVAHPMVVPGFHVWCIRVTRGIAEILLLRRRMTLRHGSSAFRSMGRDVSPANLRMSTPARRAMFLPASFTMVLRVNHRTKAKQRPNYENCR